MARVLLGAIVFGALRRLADAGGGACACAGTTCGVDCQIDECAAEELNWTAWQCVSSTCCDAEDADNRLGWALMGLFMVPMCLFMCKSEPAP
jgi:hypothetical protein